MEQIKPVDGMPVYKPSANSPKEVTEQAVVKNVAPQFVSVKGNMDPKTGVFVTEVRDGGDGKVSFQYPSKKAAAAYSRPSSDDNVDSGNSSKSSTSSLEEKQLATPSNATGENKKPVEKSASADAITDGTKSDT
jgi:hypothetical protein